MTPDYPVLHIIGTMFIFFIWVAWIWTVIMVLTDIFRRHDIGGWAKAFWVIFVIIIPFLGILIYLIAEGHGMAERNVKQAAQMQKQYDEHIKEVAGASPADEIEKAKQLRDSGAIDDAEFQKLKQRALGG